MADKQPKALRLADALETPTIQAGALRHEAAAELRRQHAEIESLKAEHEEDRRREYGSSQQTVDALKKECDALRALIANVRRCRYSVCTTICSSGYDWDIPRLNDVIDAAIGGGNG